MTPFYDDDEVENEMQSVVSIHPNTLPEKRKALS
jgi:hypothetical protein